MNHMFDKIIRELRNIKKESMNHNAKLIQELENLKTTNENMNMKLKELQDNEEKTNLVLSGFNVQRHTQGFNFNKNSTSSSKKTTFMPDSNYIDENYHLIASCMPHSYENDKLLKENFA